MGTSANSETPGSLAWRFSDRARGDEETASDLDVSVRMTDDVKRAGFESFDHLHILKDRLETLVGLPVDVVVEPIRKPELRQAVEADEIIAFE